MSKGIETFDDFVSKELLPPGSTIYTLVRERRRSGVLVVAFLCVIDGKIENISFTVASLIGAEWDGHGVVTGSEFTNVVRLSEALHGKETVGEEAIDADLNGVPFTPTADQYKAGYSLIHQRL